MVVFHLLLHECLSAVHRNGVVHALEAFAEALHEEFLVQDVGTVVHLLGGSGINLLLHLLTNLDAGQTSLLAFVCFGERQLLKAFQEVGNVGCVNTHALNQEALQTIGVGAAKEVAEGVDAHGIDHFNGFL